MGISYNTSVVRDGLVLHLDAANVKSYPGSGTVWKDLSGNGNDGTLVNGVGYSSDNNGGMVFDGVNDYVSTSLTLGDILDSSGLEQATMLFWHNSNNISPGGSHWAGSILTDTTNNDYFSAGWFNTTSFGTDTWSSLVEHGTNNIGTWGGSSGFGFLPNKFYFRCSAVSFESLNESYILADLNPDDSVFVGFNRTGAEFYDFSGSVTGSFNSTALQNDPPKYVNTNQPFNIGRRGSTYYNGSIAGVMVYNRKLSPIEIITNYNALRGRYGI